jgi:hypothetical protein
MDIEFPWVFLGKMQFWMPLLSGFGGGESS